MNSLIRPSYYQGFARYVGESKYPNLWRGLVGAWVPALGVTGGTLIDQSPYKRNGILTNMTPGADWVMTKDGYALDLDGTNDYISIPSFNYTSALSVVCKFNRNVAFTTSDDGIVAKYVGSGESNRSWTLQIETQTNGSGDPRIGVGLSSTGAYEPASSFIGVTTLLVDTDYVGAFTYDSNETNLYLNGVNEGTDSTPPAALHSSTKPINIGLQWAEEGDTNWDNYLYAGLIESVLIYSRVLSLNEIRQLYNNMLAPFELKDIPFGFVVAVGANPKGPLGMPLMGPFGGPI